MSSDPSPVTPTPLPCPFCGKKNVRVHQFNNPQRSWAAECSDVDCLYSGVRVVVQGRTEAEAVTAWNRRSGAPAPNTVQQAAFCEGFAFAFAGSDPVTNDERAKAQREAEKRFPAGSAAPASAPPTPGVCQADADGECNVHPNCPLQFAACRVDSCP